MAQLVERTLGKGEVPSSTLGISTTCLFISPQYILNLNLILLYFIQLAFQNYQNFTIGSNPYQTLGERQGKDFAYFFLKKIIWGKPFFLFSLQFFPRTQVWGKLGGKIFPVFKILGETFCYFPLQFKNLGSSEDLWEL